MNLDPTAIASLAVQIPLVLAFMVFTLVLQDRFTKALSENQDRFTGFMTEQMSTLRGLSRRFEILAMAVAVHDARETGSGELEKQVRELIEDEKRDEEEKLRSNKK